jgi:hypothetical protein
VFFLQVYVPPNPPVLEKTAANKKLQHYRVGVKDAGESVADAII